jgi:hypothetical protein
VESVEPAGIGNELWPLRLEHLPNRLVRKLGVLVGLGVGDASIKQPGVQLIEVLEPQPRREEPLTHQPDLVLDLPLLPARRRRAGNWLDQIMAAHLQEAAIVEPVLAAPAGALEQRECPIVGVKHHLLRLARIGPHEQHSAVTEPDMGDLHGHRHAAQQHNLVAPVELVGVSRSKAQRHKGCSRRLSAFVGPAPGVAAHRIVATLIPASAEFLEQPDQCQTFT